MSIVLLAFRNRFDGATLSGGSWLAGLPLANLQDGDVNKTARSSNALAASTLFAFDLGAAYSLRAIGLRYHNLSSAATVRFRTSNVGALPASAANHDSGTVNALQMAFQSDIPNDWGRQYDVMDVFAATTARWGYVEVTDTANPAGYIDIGRVIVAGGFQPAKGASYGLESGQKDLSTTVVVPSGQEYATERPIQRTEKFALNWVTQAEANYIHEMRAYVKTVNEVLYVPDPADLAHSQRFGGLGRLKELNAIGWPYPLTRAVPFMWEQKL